MSSATDTTEQAPPADRDVQETTRPEWDYLTELDELEHIARRAQRIRPALRRVFLLCDVAGRTLADAAAVLGISPAAAKLRLDWARREMQAAGAGQTDC